MKSRLALLATMSALTLATAPSPDLAAPLDKFTSRPPAAAERAPAEAERSIDVVGTMRMTATGLELALGGARIELQVWDDGRRAPESSRRAAGAHEIRARIGVDGAQKNFLLRFVPPADDGTPPAR